MSEAPKKDKNAIRNEFFAAAKFGDIDCLTSILESKLSLLNAKDNLNHGKTALIYLSIHGHIQMILTLIQHKVSLDQQDGHGDTALMYAAVEGQAETALILVQNKASLDLQNKSGETALILAAAHGHPDIARLLMLNGADLELRDKGGKDARAWAEKHDYPDVVTLIDQENRWRKCRSWIMFSLAFGKAAASGPIGSPAMDTAMSLEGVTRTVASYLP